MHVVVYETSSLTYHAKLICYVCNHRLFSLSSEIEMTEKQKILLQKLYWSHDQVPNFL